MQEFLHSLSNTATSTTSRAQLLAKALLLEIDVEAAASGIFDRLFGVVIEIVDLQAASMGIVVCVKGR